MALGIGDEVRDPRRNRRGEVLAVRVNPACLMRVVEVAWEDGEREEIEEVEFGPLED